MGVLTSRLKSESRGEGVQLAFDPDEKWSNLYREREKNHLYKWVGVRKGGELITIYERDGEDGVLKFADEKMTSMLYGDGRDPHHIKIQDYIKWKKAVNVQLGLSDDVEMQENKFKEHDALWKLNKRGVEGENIIHLLLNREQQVCYEIARILLKRYPGMANDIYMGDEMFGQSALHLAIVHDDYETVQLLLQNKADVNARACGNFFLPEDFKATNKVTDYQGYAYYGEYPLAFAACFGNKDIYDLLIQYGANPNLQDSFGNTILHMCVINYSSSMYSYAVRHWAKPADPHVVNHAGLTPLTLATKLGRKHIFEEMLELMKVMTIPVKECSHPAIYSCTIQEFWRFSDMTCSAYPLNTLDTIQPDGSTNYDSALMTVINGSTAEHLDMIGSEVIQRLLADKWKAFAMRKLIERLALLVVQLVTLSIVVYVRPTEISRLYMDEPQWDDWIRTVCEVLTILNCVFFVFFQQFGEIRTQGIAGYFRNLKTVPAKSVFCLANICLLLCIPFRILRLHELEEALFVFALPGSWIFLLFFARSAKLTGPFVQMIYSMIAVFFFVGKDMDAKQQLNSTNPHFCAVEGYDIYTYDNFPETFITLFRASMGGYDYEEFACANYEVLTKTLFVLYMFVMPIMMINILIAMMGNTYTTVIAQAEKAWRQQYAQIVMVLERSVGRDKLAASQLEYSIKLNDTNDAALEVRGLMVIKQTKKTRAKQRKQAIHHWKTIGRKVIHTIAKVGKEHAILLLHGHDRLDPIIEDDKTVNWHPVEANADPDEGIHEETVVVPTHRFAQSATSMSDAQRNMRVRGVEMVPSGDIPNMPNLPTRTPPQRAVSPKIRHDMFRRKGSPGSGGSK
ncbi:transient-receptor-potential calcium channel protein [Necator americanus]|uniref:Transient-receptor-potential calcium channel protein n=1 Tax=Necator americanus TaxID=51031 RepID=W2SV15_NECAM|nr:transient-receptor-potential calcium channel protein [Necator americanus]ETN73348.1 transient-receptor-potential calcium channel protein [Necator americanus]